MAHRYQEQHQDSEGQPRIFDVTEGLKSTQTKRSYKSAFQHFLKITINHDN